MGRVVLTRDRWRPQHNIRSATAGKRACTDDGKPTGVSDRDVAFPVINFFFFGAHRARTYTHIDVYKNTRAANKRRREKKQDYYIHIYICILSYILSDATNSIRAAFCTRRRRERGGKKPVRSGARKPLTAACPKTRGTGQEEATGRWVAGDGARANRDLSVNGMSRVRSTTFVRWRAHSIISVARQSLFFRRRSETNG